MWAARKKVAHAIGNFQARILLTVIYAVLILPCGVVVRFFADSLHIKKRPETWLKRPGVSSDMEHACQHG